jgi:hypothetical protein
VPPHLWLRSQPSRQRAQGQDGGGESTVIAIGREDGAGDPVRVERSDGAGDVRLGAFHHFGARAVIEREGGPPSRVVLRLLGLAGVSPHPPSALAWRASQSRPFRIRAAWASRFDPVEGKDRHGGREGAGGELPVPDTARGSIGEERLSGVSERAAGLGPQIARDGRIGRHVFYPLSPICKFCFHSSALSPIAPLLQGGYRGKIFRELGLRPKRVVVLWGECEDNAGIAPQILAESLRRGRRRLSRPLRSVLSGPCYTLGGFSSTRTSCAKSPSHLLL